MTMYKYSILILLGLTLGFSSCKSSKSAISSTNTTGVSTTNPVITPTPPPPVEKEITMQVTGLKAISLQEPWSLADEIVLTYTLTSVDENQKVTQVLSGSWGVENLKKGAVITTDKFQPISLTIPPKGKLLATVVLMEVDDYEKISKTLKFINTFGGIAKIPTMVISLAEYETPLAIVFGGLQAAGFAVSTLDRFNENDVLGQNTFTIPINKNSLAKPRYTLPLTFKGTGMTDPFNYELSYELTIKPKQ